LRQDVSDPRTYAEQWNTRYKVGVLRIFIDDMEWPFMTTYVNIGEMIDRDNFYTEPVGVVSGQMYISISASNQNSLFDTIIPSTNSNTFLKFRDQGPREYDQLMTNNTWWLKQQNSTDSEGNFINYGSLHLLRFKFFEWPRCPMT